MERKKQKGRNERKEKKRKRRIPDRRSEEIKKEGIEGGSHTELECKFAEVSVWTTVSMFVKVLLVWIWIFDFVKLKNSIFFKKCFDYIRLNCNK